MFQSRTNMYKLEKSAFYLTQHVLVYVYGLIKVTLLVDSFFVFVTIKNQFTTPGVTLHYHRRRDLL